MADVADLLGDIDAWGLRVEGDWLRFTGVLEHGQGARGYLRARAGGDVIADAPGPLYGLFSLGGARRAGFTDGPVGFRFNVLAPGDDIGAVGLEGTAQAVPTAAMQHLPHASRDALIAETLLGWRRAAMRGQPLFLVRAETDGSASIADLARGAAYANFLTAVDSLILAATALGKAAKVLAVSIDFGLEDLTTPAAAFAEGLRALMRQVERDLARRGLQRPIFLYAGELGMPGQPAHPAMLAAWELAWSHGPHQLALPGPGYMFEHSRHGRLTDRGRLDAAEMDAHAILALSQRAPWACPSFLLAEYAGREIRVTAQALAPLVIDAQDPFGAGPRGGFTLTGPAQITGLRLDPQDDRALILTCDRPPEGGMLHYACEGPGALRDTWAAPSRAGGVLHRWAYPAALPLHPTAGGLHGV